MTDALTTITSLALGVSLAAASGMRVFLPLVLSGLAIRFELFGLPLDVLRDQAWLGSNSALICFGVATILEAAAYKIPYVDHLLDVVGSPAAVLAGAVLACSFLTGIQDPTLKYSLGIIAGGSSAGVVYGTTALGRAISTKTTAGIANPVYALGELGGAATTTLLAFIAPIITVFALGFLVVFVLFGLKKLLLTKSSPD